MSSARTLEDYRRLESVPTPAGTLVSVELVMLEDPDTRGSFDLSTVLELAHQRVSFVNCPRCGDSPPRAVLHRNQGRGSNG